MKKKSVRKKATPKDWKRAYVRMNNLHNEALEFTGVQQKRINELVVDNGRLIEVNQKLVSWWTEERQATIDAAAPGLVMHPAIKLPWWERLWKWLDSTHGGIHEPR